MLALLCVGAGVWLNMSSKQWNYANLKNRVELWLLTEEARGQIEQMEKENEAEIKKIKDDSQGEIDLLKNKIKKQKEINAQLRKRLEEKEESL